MSEFSTAQNETVAIIMYNFCLKTHSNIYKQNAANVFYLGKEKRAFCIYKLDENRDCLLR